VVWLVDPETRHMYRAADRNLPPYLQEPARMSGSRGAGASASFREGTLAAAHVDVIHAAVCSRGAGAAEGADARLAHHASVPLTFQGKPLGIMNITARRCGG